MVYTVDVYRAVCSLVVVVHYIGWGHQSPNPQENTVLNGNFVFDLHCVFQEHNPGIKRDLPLMTNALAPEFNTISELQKLEFKWDCIRADIWHSAFWASRCMFYIHTCLCTHARTHHLFPKNWVKEDETDRICSMNDSWELHTEFSKNFKGSDLGIDRC